MANKKRRSGKATAQTLSNYHVRDKWFTAAKLFLTLSPLISLGYLQTAAAGSNMQLAELLTANPQITVSFLASMTGPFAAYLMGFIQKHLYQGDAPYAMTNLTLLMIGEAMLCQAVYFIMMIVLMYFVFDMTGVNPVKAIRRKWNDHFWRDISGSILLLLICGFCMFVSVRLGMR